jgi:hypothetical protein
MATSQRDWEKLKPNYEAWEVDGIEQVIDESGKYYLSTRGQIVAYFRKKFPGIKTQKNGKTIEEWKRPLSEALQPFTKGKKGQQEIPSIMRRFQNRGKKSWEMTQPSKAQQAEYVELGKSLGWQHLIAPDDGYNVHFDGYVRFSECEPKSFDVDVTGKNAEDLAAHPEYLMEIIMRIWLDEDDDDGVSTGVCTVDADHGTETDPNGIVSDPSITVKAIGENHTPTEHKVYKKKQLKKYGRIEEDSYL